MDTPSTTPTAAGLDRVDVQVIDDPAVAAVALEPTRARILSALGEPGSATTVAAALGETRQRVNHHLRTLETHGLVRQIGERPRRGLTERIVVASAHHYVVAPDLLSTEPVEPSQVDRLSSAYLLALAVRLVRELTRLRRGAATAHRPLATLAIDTDVRFASAADRAAFTRELGDAVAAISSRYHDESAPDGRWHRLIVAAHPRPAALTQEENTE